MCVYMYYNMCPPLLNLGTMHLHLFEHKNPEMSSLQKYQSIVYLFCFVQALQAPACHENMIEVGGYNLGEFGNLIAGDPRSRYT